MKQCVETDKKRCYSFCLDGDMSQQGYYEAVSERVVSRVASTRTCLRIRQDDVIEVSRVELTLEVESLSLKWTLPARRSFYLQVLIFVSSYCASRAGEGAA